MRTAIQLFTLRELDEPLARTLDRVAETDLDGVETGPDELTDDEVQATLDETGLEIVSVGGGPEALDGPDEALVEACAAADADYVMLGWLGPERFEDAESAREAAEQVTEWAEGLDEHGIQLLYHNHCHEFVELEDGRLAFEVFADHLEEPAGIELDLGWVGTGGGDPAEWLRRLADQVPIVHCKDMHFADSAPTYDVQEAEFANLGEGDLDLHGLLEIAHEQGVEWAIYEHDQPEDPAEALRRDSQVLVEAVEETRP